MATDPVPPLADFFAQLLRALARRLVELQRVHLLPSPGRQVS